MWSSMDGFVIFSFGIGNFSVLFTVAYTSVITWIFFPAPIVASSNTTSFTKHIVVHPLDFHYLEDDSIIKNKVCSFDNEAPYQFCWLHRSHISIGWPIRDLEIALSFVNWWTLVLALGLYLGPWWLKGLIMLYFVGHVHDLILIFGFGLSALFI